MEGSSHLTSSEVEAAASMLHFRPHTLISARPCTTLVFRPFAATERRQPPAKPHDVVAGSGAMASGFVSPAKPSGAATANLFSTPLLSSTASHRVARAASQSAAILNVGSASVSVTGKPESKVAVTYVAESTPHESAAIPRTSTSQMLPVPYVSRSTPVNVSVVVSALRTTPV